MSVTERQVHPDLKTLLVNNEPFLYAHLVKFERPSRPLTTYGLVSTSKERYTYLTDGSVNVVFDDGSTSLAGTPNGSQTYIANKVLNVGATQEQTKATTSNSNLVIDGNALGATVTSYVNIAPVSGTSYYDITFLAPTQQEDIVNTGFREGDKVTINYTLTGTSYSIPVNINSFRSNNVIRVSQIDNTLSTLANTSITMSLSSEEIISILLNKKAADYSSFINREVFIYRAYFTPVDITLNGNFYSAGSMIGGNSGPTLIFKGIISNVGFDDSDSQIKVTWGLTSHWGDFAQVKGRITSDSSHRALNENGIPQPESALKKIYAYDKGFAHSETAIHMLAHYTVMVDHPEYKTKKGFLGIGAGVKTKHHMVAEDRQTNLDFELNAKSIPIVYGVRLVEGIGVFADTLANSSKTVYLATVISEGEIGGLYDVYIDGNSLICNDSADYTARSKVDASNNTVSVVCRGQADRGDVLQGQQVAKKLGVSSWSYVGKTITLNFGSVDPGFKVNDFITVSGLAVTGTGAANPPNGGFKVTGISGTTIQYTAYNTPSGTPTAGTGTVSSYSFFGRDVDSLKSGQNFIGVNNIQSYLAGTYNFSLNQSGEIGLIDGNTFTLTSPQDISFDFFSGRPGQAASAQLSKIAYDGVLDKTKGFKIQAEHWNNADTNEYWGPNHRLLDTAYIVGKFTIADDATTIPEIKYVIRGKVINCYNYDYSYKHDKWTLGELASDFKLGDRVNIYSVDSAGVETLRNSNTQIIDKWKFYNPDGTENYRFIFKDIPDIYGGNLDTTAIPNYTKLRMKLVSDTTKTWTMTTFNHALLPNSTGVITPIEANISSVTTTGANIVFNFSTSTSTMASNMSIESTQEDNSPRFQVVNTDYSTMTSGDIFPYTLMTGSVTTTSGATTGSLTTYYLGSSSTGYSTSIINEANTLVGKKLVSKNTLYISSLSTSIDYTGALIEITRYDSSTGKSLVQEAEIIGSINGIITIDTVWDFIPVSTDYVKIYPKYADSRVSINPAIQLLDYISSPTYGRGLNVFNYSSSSSVLGTKDIDLPSWLETARKCDSSSNITVNIGTSLPTTTPKVGDIYSFTNTQVTPSVFIWQGTVAKDPYPVTVNGTVNYFIEFTSCSGKLTNKKNTWKTWKTGDLLYDADTFVFSTVTADGVAGTTNLSTTTSVLLTKVSGTGSNITITFSPSVGNPVQAYKSGSKISGYSLYDADDINYWKLCGWDEHAQRYVTKYQTNMSIDTANPLFDNINGILEHFNGILRYTAGKYSLDLEEVAGDIPTTDIRTITTDDIIGRIQLTDEGTRSAFNSLTAAFADPANKFEARSVSFFNSEYLKADRNVPKKGNLSIAGITNYYNTRLLADSFLNKSRFGLTINMTVRSHGILMLAGTIIQVIYPRYAWSSPGKKFRIESITYQPDGVADIVAKEYDDSFYGISNISRNKGSGSNTIGGAKGDGGVILVPSTTGPTNLTTSTDKYNQIVLEWSNGSTSGSETRATEVWRSDDSNFTNASIIALVPVTAGTTNTYIDPIPQTPGETSSVSKYYWVRHRITTQ